MSTTSCAMYRLRCPRENALDRSIERQYNDLQFAQDRRHAQRMSRTQGWSADAEDSNSVCTGFGIHFHHVSKASSPSCQPVNLCKSFSWEAGQSSAHPAGQEAAGDFEGAGLRSLSRAGLCRLSLRLIRPHPQHGLEMLSRPHERTLPLLGSPQAQHCMQVVPAFTDQHVHTFPMSVS